MFAAIGITGHSVTGVNISTVLGTKPQMVSINPGDNYIGLITALKLMKKEDKIVILNSVHSDVLHSTVFSALKYTKTDLPIYHSTREEEIKQFLDSPKGCFIAADITDFRGMETKNLIVVAEGADVGYNIKDPFCDMETKNLIAVGYNKDLFCGMETKNLIPVEGHDVGYNKDLLLRCTTQLVVIQPHGGYKRRRRFNHEYCEIIVPYQKQSDSYEQYMSAIIEDNLDEYKSISRTRLRISYTQFKDSEVKQLKQEDLRNIIGVLLNSASTNTRRKSIQNLSTETSEELIEEILRMKEETSKEKLISLDILLEEIERRISEVNEISRDIDSLLDESSPEARLKKIRGLSPDYIPELFQELGLRMRMESSEEKRKKMEMLYVELYTRKKRVEMMQLTEDLLNESSVEARLKRIRGLSRDYIPELARELGLQKCMESSGEKMKKMEMLYLECQKRVKMMQLTEDLLNESSVEARLERIRGLSTDYIPKLFRELGLHMRMESSGEKRKKIEMLYLECQKRVEMMQLKEDLLDELSVEGRLEIIRGFSTNYLSGFLIELWRRIGKESSEWKKMKMEMLYSELYTESKKKSGNDAVDRRFIE